VLNVSRRLAAHRVRVRVLARVRRVDLGTVSVVEGYGGEPAESRADLVVVRTALRTNDALARELDGALDGVGPAVATIGDASAPRRLNHAVLDANLALRAFEAGRLTPGAFVLF
jgi:hypothetical protein